jgi:lysophospholipase L1-like esterase
MSERRAFRPTVSGLEDRVVPSGVAGVLPLAALPVAGNDANQPGQWTDLHEGFVAQARQGGEDVLFLGDSITYFWGDPAHGAAAWRAGLEPLGAVGFGIPGDQTQNLLWRLQNGELDGRPKVAVVMIGVNDLGHGQSPADTATGIAAVVDTIRAESPQTKVLLLSLLPAGGTDSFLNPGIARVNAMIAGLDDGRDVRFLDVASRFLGPDGDAAPGLLADGLHPSAAGYSVLADALTGPIEDLLAPRTEAAPAPDPAAHAGTNNAPTSSRPPATFGAVTPPAAPPLWTLPPDADALGLTTPDLIPSNKSSRHRPSS